jgi:hypothetical protein
LFLSRFGCLSVWGVYKHHNKNIPQNYLTLVFFWPLTHPPTTGVAGFVFVFGDLAPKFPQPPKKAASYSRHPPPLPTAPLVDGKSSKALQAQR